jgi:hypothetical protein
MPVDLMWVPPNVVFKDRSHFVFEIDQDYHIFEPLILLRQFVIYNIKNCYEIAFLVLQEDGLYWVDILTDDAPKHLAATLADAVALAAAAMDAYLMEEQ